MMIHLSLGTKIILGIIITYIFLNVLFQVCFVDTVSHKVRQMKRILNEHSNTKSVRNVVFADNTENVYSLGQTKNTVSSSITPSPSASTSPYTNILHEWWGDHRWVGELSGKVSEDLTRGWRMLDVFYIPVLWMNSAMNTLGRLNDTVIHGTDKIYREIEHRIRV